MDSIENDTKLALVDSGHREQFTSGAVREVNCGKGRCDMLPLDEVAMLFEGICPRLSIILTFISSFMHTHHATYLISAVNYFVSKEYDSMYDAILDVSHQYEIGSQKYEERNWEKGMPVHCFIDSGVRHCIQHYRGDSTENHARAFVWNMLGAVWMLNNRAEYDDLPTYG